jgi:hypothetical protein
MVTLVNLFASGEKCLIYGFNSENFNKRHLSVSCNSVKYEIYMFLRLPFFQFEANITEIVQNRFLFQIPLLLYCAVDNHIVLLKINKHSQSIVPF